MHMTLSPDEWLSLNARYCNRYLVRLTPANCAANRIKTDDCRCNGCNGLEDVQREPERTVPVIIHDEPEPETCCTDPMSRALAKALYEILAGDEWLDEEPVDDLEDDEEDDLEPQATIPNDTGNGEVDPLIQLLLGELQGYGGETEPEPLRVEIVEPPERKRHVKVYVGRCLKCEGYMVPAPWEGHDGIADREVYRCFNCGWRISPAYDYNRKHPGNGWE